MGAGGAYPAFLQNCAQLQRPFRVSQEGGGWPKEGRSLVSQSHLWVWLQRTPSPALWLLHVLYQLGDLNELLSVAKPVSVSSAVK